MKRIIIPTDFSAHATQAIEYCHRLFEGEEVTWVLLHTFGADVYTSAASMGLKADTSAMDTLLQASDSRLQQLKETLQHTFKQDNFTYEVVSRYDFLPDAINFLLSESPAFMVAMGTQGATGAKEIFLGSNAVRIMEKVTGTAVFAIPEQASFVTPRKIALATTYSHLPVDSQMEVFKHFARVFKTEVTMIHISDEVRLNEKQVQYRNWLQQALREHDPAIYTLNNTHIGKAIEEYIENTNTDLLGIISRKHGFFESLLKKSTLKALGYHSKIPLLVMHHQ